ncbi:MAG TPA: hypothetical protein EYQ74_02820 [Planctomycetes bacterium]|nr:hypothetical protein [Planctomycetota bacterium]HIK62238.1 hypothetical protein [Planctomycetota bacterium]
MGEPHIHAPEPSDQVEAERRATRVRRALEGHAPAELLTVGEVVRLLGLSEALLRRRIKSGRLLHETGRRSGREVRLIRVVDLLAVFGSPGSAETEGRKDGSSTAPDPPIAHALLQLKAERDGLLERCEDLDDRLALLALERQDVAPTGSPSRSQWLELESVVASRFVWWRRPSTLGWMASFVALFWLWNGADAARILAQERVVDIVEEHRAVRGQFTGQLAEWRDEARGTQVVLAQERRDAARDRTLFDERLQGAHAQADRASAMVREERLRFEGDRLGWSSLLEDTQQTLGLRDAAWRAAVASNEDQQAVFRSELAARDADLREERERSARGDLLRREVEAQDQVKRAELIEALEGQIGAAQAQSSQFKGELDRMGALADQQEARITEGLGRMERMQAEHDARLQEAEARDRLQMQLGELGHWLVLWAPRLRMGALLGARASDSVRRADDHEDPR